MFVPEKSAWERMFAWPQALKRLPGRLFSIKLPINGLLEFYFCFILTTRPHCLYLLCMFLFGASMGATKHEHQAFPSRMHKKDGEQGVFASFALKNVFSTPTANCPNVVGEL